MPRLIRRYEDIAGASRRMLDAALVGDWEQVARLESQCQNMIIGLKQSLQADALSKAEDQRRIELLRGILRDDAQMRAQAEPWLRNLENFLSTPSPPSKKLP
jgi:flagellar protein FliT